MSSSSGGGAACVLRRRSDKFEDMIKPTHLAILGSGSAGHALAEAFSIVKLHHPRLGLEASYFAERSKKLAEISDPARTVVAIAGPHALHAERLLEVASGKFAGAVVEKPVCTDDKQAAQLREVKLPVVVCHGYRMMWGPETLEHLVASGELGELISVEGRYWQSSAARPKQKTESWKNNKELSGGYDVVVDLGSHWLDLVSFITGRPITNLSVWRHYANSEAEHRDTHVHLTTSGDKFRSFGSVSKTVHGAGNDLEIDIVGSKGRASWKFADCDRVYIGGGRNMHTQARTEHPLSSSKHSTFHGLGWLEGYVEGLTRFFSDLNGLETRSYPTLPQATQIMSLIFEATRTEQA